MKQLSILFLFCLLFAACSDDDKEKEPVFVTNVVVGNVDKIFRPGEIITISAQGFRENDQYVLDMRWPLDDPSGPIKEGYMIANPEFTEKSDNKISFYVPGHMPAATLSLFLVRNDRKMALCKVSVANGQAPKELQLYGITNSRSMALYPYGVEQLDLTTGAVTKVTQLSEGEDFSQVINSPGSQILSGKFEKDGKTFIGQYDLCTNRWGTRTNGGVVTLITGGANLAVLQVSETEVCFSRINTSIFSRMDNMPSPPEPTATLPQGMKASALSQYPGIRINGKIVFSAKNEDGTFSPVEMNLASNNYKMQAYEPIKADALIPFWMLGEKNNTSDSYEIAACFAVVSTNSSSPDCGTTLHRWNPITHTLEEPFATFPYGNTIRSVATHISEDLKTQEIYLLMEGRESGGLIHIYNLQNKEWRFFRNFGFPYSEIVFAR